jgi:hypothetical protein
MWQRYMYQTSASIKLRQSSPSDTQPLEWGTRTDRKTWRLPTNARITLAESAVAVSTPAESREPLFGVKNAIKAPSLHSFRSFTAAIRPENPMPRLPTRLLVLATLPITAACQGGSSQHSSASGAESTASSGTLATMAAPSGKPDSAVEATVAAVTNDVRALQKAPPAVAMGKLPAHEKLVNGMLTDFETRIRAMHVQADPAWSSVIDSVRTDLARLPAMKAEALPGFLPQHLNRVMRIVACIQMVRS